jgi:hypothetical protein
MPGWKYRYTGNLATSDFDEPKKDFTQHVVVRSGNAIFDPAYGKEYVSLKAWQDASLDAIFRQKNGVVYAKKIVTTSPLVVRIDDE